MKSWSMIERKVDGYIQWIDFARLKKMQEAPLLDHGCTHAATLRDELQSISVVVLLNRGLMSVFTVTAAFCAAALVWAIVRGQSMQAALAIGGGLLYLIGTYFVTMFVLVPRNDELLLLDPNDPVAAGPWRRFLRRWLAWNYVRTAAASAATLSFVLTLASE